MKGTVVNINVEDIITSVADDVVGGGVSSILGPGDINTFLLGVLFVIVALVVVFIVKRVLENFIIGVVGFLILKFVLGINIDLIPGLIISLLFGLGGLGVLLILHFFGIV